MKQIKISRDRVFIEICNEMKQRFDHRFIAARYFGGSRSTTKEKLGGWLEAMSHILSEYCIPWLEKAAPLAEEVRTLRSEVKTLKDENISYQKQIIGLQNLLIEKQGEQLNAVKSTVETEMKTYSAAVKSTVQSEMKSISSNISKTCTARMTPKTIEAAVQKVADKEERSKNVIIYGLKEEKEEKLKNRVEEVLAEIGEKPLVKDCCRVGLKRDAATRPIKFSLSSSAHVFQVLRSAKTLRTKDGFRFIYVCPDRSIEERRAYKQLIEELKQKRISEPNKVHILKNNKIVSSERDSGSASTGKT